MDVAAGTEHVPFSERTLKALPLYFFILTALFPANARAIEESSPMHWSGDKTLWDRRANRVELFGHAAVHQQGESLTADHIALDLDSRTLDAKGHCVYIASDSVIYGEEMHFNLDTRTGTIVGGRVTSDQFVLTGERINKLGPGRFQTHRGEYTTCRDCPNSWSITGGDVDMQFEGYAYMQNVTGKVNEAPLFWVPYLIIPLKTKRQTGFLFPRFGFSDEGFTFVQPFFWAIGRSADMTIGLGEFAGRGGRVEWEGRYSLGERSAGIANAYYLKDQPWEEYLLRKNSASALKAGPQQRVTPHRWAMKLGQTQVLPFGIDQKLLIQEVSDNHYPFLVGDVGGGGDPYLPSTFSLSHTNNQVSTYLTARRYRNLLHTNEMEFDPNTVQVYPSGAVTTNNKFVLGSPVAAGMTLGMTNFTRTGPAFDRDPYSPPTALGDPYRLGVDPIRKATRVAVTPSLYTTIRPWDVMTIVPSLEYRAFFYEFHNEVPDLSRGYLLFRTDFSTQFERIFEWPDDEDVSRTKHLIRPLLTYNLIPYVYEPNVEHPFMKQIEYAKTKNFSGYNFDNHDIVPRDTSRTYSNYFIPIGHSLSYGFTTQVIRRRSKLDAPWPSYGRTVEFKAGQTLNFREFRNPPEDRRPLSRFFSNLSLSFDKWSFGADYVYVPYEPIDHNTDRHVFSTNAQYTIESATRQGVMTFERSIAMGYTRSRLGSRTENVNGTVNFSVNDYFLPKLGISYDLLVHRAVGANAALIFQDPSRCWKVELSGSKAPCPVIKPDDTGYCHKVGLDLSLNLTGSGFGGVSEVSNAVTSK